MGVGVGVGATRVDARLVLDDTFAAAAVAAPRACGEGSLAPRGGADGARQGDAAGAANLYRLALHYADDAASTAYAKSGLNEARATLANAHLQRARHEEKERRWSDAVASYAKALEGRPDDPAVCERLANALREEGLDLVRAAQLAELAVSRAPRRAANRKTLGLIYAAQGVVAKALEHLERAVELDPADQMASRAVTALRERRR